MKKILLASIALIAVLAACSKENSVVKPVDKGLTFTVSTEGVKTILEGEDKVCWLPDDMISICGIPYRIQEIKEDQSCAIFEKMDPGLPDPEPWDGKYIAVYPVTLGSYPEIQLPQEQYYNHPNSLSAVSPMYAESESTDLVFTNVCGILSLVVKGTGTVKKVEVKDAEKCLWGSCAINDGAAEITYEEEDEIKEHLSGVVLNCSEGVELSEDWETVFLVALPVGEYSNLSFVFYNDADTPCEFCLRSEATAVITKNTIYPIHVSVTFPNPGLEVGSFSVGEGKQVIFSTGNLYTVAEMDNTPVIENYLYSNAYIYGRYAHQLPWNDWGNHYFEQTGEEGWRMLTSAEWKYLLEERQTSGPRYLNATETPVVVSGVKYYGLLIFPDDYSGDAGIETYTWAKMQRLGIAFLPATGCDYIPAGDGVRKYGRYWAGDDINVYMACNMAFGPSGVSAHNAFGKYAGYAVRLVHDIE
ncbi:MAG: hypothetical protein MJY62_02535 [Bacteroidales bacterium]|nr:hypothetical protein [Bacteroidales bacterium]